MKAAVLALLLAVSGCAQLQNRVACTLAQDEAYVVSKYMRLGVSSDLAPQDAQIVCQRSVMPVK